MLTLDTISRRSILTKTITGQFHRFGTNNVFITGNNDQASCTNTVKVMLNNAVAHKTKLADMMTLLDISSTDVQFQCKLQISLG